MDRLACVDVTALALQLLLKQHPDWSGLPVAVVDRDLPGGRILEVNRQAWQEYVRPGNRYGDVLVLAPRLRVGVITRTALDHGINTITKYLQRFSPRVESALDMPGIFWLDASGLGLLYPSLRHWAVSLNQVLSAADFYSTIVVGFSRFGTYALARTLSQQQPRVSVINNPNEETMSARAVRIDRLNWDHDLSSTLRKLGIQTVGDFLQLPTSEIRQRLGEQAYRLQRMASGEFFSPLKPQTTEPKPVQRISFDEAVTDNSQLIFAIKGLLHQLIERLTSQQEAISRLHLQLQFASATLGNTEKTIQPAEATLEATTLLDLIHISLNTWRLPVGIVAIALYADTSKATREQLTLLPSSNRRNLDAAAHAFARLRTEFGDDCVVRAGLHQAHLPEGQFAWSPIDKIGKAHPHNRSNRPLIRRIRNRASPLPSRPRNEHEDHWLAGNREYGAVQQYLGPYIVSGGWWHSNVHREYYFVETCRGRILWIYYDRMRRRWFLHGEVE